MTEIKRLHYFTHQFLVEKDFTDEQSYHIDMRRRHNCAYHSWGIIAEGLEVTKTGDKEVAINPGMAIDKDGQEIVLPSDPTPSPVNLSTFGANTDVYLTICYQEFFDPVDNYASGGVNNNTRTTERPQLVAATTAPPTDGLVIPLALIHMDANGIVSSIDMSIRKIAGSKIVPGTVGTDELADEAVTRTKLANNAVTAFKLQSDAQLDANRAVTTSHIKDGAVTEPKLANNAVTALKLQSDAQLDANRAVTTNHIKDAAVTLNKLATAARPIASVDGVSNPGGDIDLAVMSGSAITITPDNTNKKITIGESHSALTNNPHATTAAQIGALLEANYEQKNNSSTFLNITKNQGDGYQSTIITNFKPLYVIVTGGCWVTMNSRNYGFPISAWGNLRNNNISLACPWFFAVRFTSTDWGQWCGFSTNLVAAEFRDQSIDPPIGEDIVVNIVGVTNSGFTIQLNRTPYKDSSGKIFRPLDNLNLYLVFMSSGNS